MNTPHENLQTTPDSPPATPAAVDAVVLHTDSGSGTSQAEHWPANVDGPKEDAEGE